MNPNSILIKASAKFQRQYLELPQTRDFLARKFPLTWNVDILAHGRSQLLVIASEELSLYSLLIPVGRSKDPSTFLLPFQKRLAELLPSPQQPVVGSISNRTNRQVIGSQNELLFTASIYLVGADKPATPNQLGFIEEKLNSTYMSYLGRERPREAFARLIKELE